MKGQMMSFCESGSRKPRESMRHCQNGFWFKTVQITLDSTKLETAAKEKPRGINV
jgi:hypothetical protein